MGEDWTATAAPRGHGCAWIRDDPLPSRRGLLAEGVTLLALLLVLAAGLVIAMLPAAA